MVKFCSPTTGEGKRGEKAHYCLLGTVCQALICSAGGGLSWPSTPFLEPPQRVPPAPVPGLAALTSREQIPLINKPASHLSLQRAS